MSRPPALVLERPDDLVGLRDEVTLLFRGRRLRVQPEDVLALHRYLQVHGLVVVLASASHRMSSLGVPATLVITLLVRQLELQWTVKVVEGVECEEIMIAVITQEQTTSARIVKVLITLV